MCGIIGILGSSEAARESLLGLSTLQHRGQDAAGILTYDDQGFHLTKNKGLVDAVFDRENTDRLQGQLAIAHNRYSTSGRGDLNDVQPFVLSYPFGLGIAHNGNIINIEQLKEELKTKWRRHLLSHSDTEIILNLFAEFLAQELGDNAEALEFKMIARAYEKLCASAKGSFSVVIMIAGHGLVAFRDPNGLRPLVLGKRVEDGETAHMFASEEVALSINGYERERDVNPGEVIFISNDGVIQSNNGAGALEHRPCMFEWIYFASPESTLDNVPVYGTRTELGNKLAEQVALECKRRNIQADIVAPVPETARIAASALSEALKLPYREVLIKDRYVKRTFILDSAKKRKEAVSLKLSPVKSEIKGKKVMLVDDSIVRGTTSRKLIELLRKAGAREVYFVSTCPPIKHPCYYGIDFPNGKELLAHNRSAEEIEKEMGADAVIYMTRDNLKNAIIAAGKGKSNFKTPCMACLNEDYPTDISAGVKMAAAREKDQKQETRS